MTKNDTVRDHKETIDFIAGLILDFSKINGFEVTEVLANITHAVFIKWDQENEEVTQ